MSEKWVTYGKTTIKAPCVEAVMEGPEHMVIYTQNHEFWVKSSKRTVFHDLGIIFDDDDNEGDAI